MNRGLILAAGVVIAANAVVLAHVAYNRSRVVQRIELSEFELPVQHTSDDNSGTSLRLDTITPNAMSPADGWPGASKLQEAGFDLNSRREQLPHPVFVAFEVGGDVWQKYTQEYQRRFPKAAQYGQRTRVIPVDIARDAETLLRAYPNRDRYVIIKAAINVYAYNRVRSGRVVPEISEIYVPLPFSEMLRPLSRSAQRQDQPRYSVTLCFGRLDEPWIESVAMSTH